MAQNGLSGESRLGSVTSFFLWHPRLDIYTMLNHIAEETLNFPKPRLVLGEML